MNEIIKKEEEYSGGKGVFGPRETFSLKVSYY